MTLQNLPRQCETVLTARGSGGSQAQSVAQIVASLPESQRPRVKTSAPATLGASVAVPTLRTVERADAGLRPPAMIGQ